MIHVGDDDLVALLQHLADAEANETDERGRIHAEADFLRIAGVDEQCHALAGIGNDLVHLDTATVARAALNVEIDQMVRHRVEHALRNLRTGGIVEKDEIASLLQRRKHRANGLDRKRGFVRIGLGRLVLVHDCSLE